MPKDSANDDGPAKVGHNSIEVEGADFLAFAARYDALEAKRDAINKEIKALSKHMQGAGIRMVEFKAAKKLMQLGRDDATDHVTHLGQYLRWFRAPIGEQFVLDLQTAADAFDDRDAESEKRAVQDASFAGFNAGLQDKAMSENPYLATTPAGQTWIKNWHDGQAAMRHELPPFKQDDDALDDDDDRPGADEDGEDDGA